MQNNNSIQFNSIQLNSFQFVAQKQRKKKAHSQQIRILLERLKTEKPIKKKNKTEK